MKPGEWITAHMRSGDYPAIITRVNTDGTVSLTAFKPGEILHADNILRYVAMEDDEQEDKAGMWSEGLDFG